MFKQLFEEQRRYLNHFIDHIDLGQMEAIYQASQTSTGLMIFMGVGKSGIIAEKIAMTLTSTGRRALYLSPMNFLHGDIGIVSEEDLLFLLSKSGETEELLHLIPFVRRRNPKLIAVVSNDQSRLAKACDLKILLPVEKELCPFNLAPTTSTMVQLMFGDALAMALMKAKPFHLNEYALTHPQGNIGKKMTLLVEDLMLKEEDIPICHSHHILKEVLVELSNKKCGCVLIVDAEKNLLGIFTDGDLRRALQTKSSEVLAMPIEQLMTRSMVTISHNMLAWEALQLMQADSNKWVMTSPVVKDKKVIGIIRMHDIIHSGLA